MQLHVEGLPLVVLTQALITYRAELKKARKKDEDMGIPTQSHQDRDRAAHDLLDQIGWKPKDTSAGKIEVVDDKRQIPLPLGDQNDGARVVQAKVQCLACSRMFAVPVGDVTRSCPDCGTTHRVKADATGEVVYHKDLVKAPDEIAAMLKRKLTEGEKPLSMLEEKRLELWLKENPDYVVEPAEPGARLADPTRPGSGNPHRVDCRTIAGRECDGFDSTDTPGTSLCPKCGGKYVVELVEGIVVTRQWDADRDAERDGDPAAPSAPADDNSSDDDTSVDEDDEPENRGDEWKGDPS